MGARADGGQAVAVPAVDGSPQRPGSVKPTRTAMDSTLNINEATAALVPDPLNYGWRDYGPRVSIWRVMEILDRHGLRASTLLNADVCQQYPQIIEAGNARGWPTARTTPRSRPTSATSAPT
ncbi:MAG TPA: hypothetical protein VM347_24995 [Nonomuraea sp.]|nr:hypothetical protein [Nonomuraea sp.]